MPARTVGTALLLPSFLLAATAACGSDSSAGAEPPALTKDQARRVLDRYTAAVARAGANLDGAALPAVQADPQLAMDTAAFKFRRASRQRSPALAFAKPEFYIPRMAGYPRWFAAAAVTGPGGRALRHALLFTQARPGEPWLLTADPFPADAALSRVALDPGGYATPVKPGAEGLAVPPAGLAAAHAALLTSGPAAPGAAVLAPGPKTDEAYGALRQGQADLKRAGVALASRFSAAPSPVYALRTKDRGALVWYLVRQNEAYTSARRGRLAVSGDLVGLVPARAARRRMDTTVLVQYLATVPPEGRATVTGMYRKAIAVRGS
ncbi:hypothetical protein [Spirillospora sp. NBC_01491]|uniref:hypothetical protein n=1 Tax=Spirillospora sp. NBC_01491 TaxID=2976007 RepID=UPI002E36D19E|nr:hypothetical protein [Spirillospora sp. NBC_01491]